MDYIDAVMQDPTSPIAQALALDFRNPQRARHSVREP